MKEEEKEEEKIEYRKVVAIKGYAIRLVKNDQRIKEIIAKTGKKDMEFSEMLHRFVEEHAQTDVVK